MKKLIITLAAVVTLAVAFFAAGQSLDRAMDTARDAVQSSGGTVGIAYGIDR